jgi:hypothetical protein
VGFVESAQVSAALAPAEVRRQQTTYSDSPLPCLLPARTLHAAEYVYVVEGERLSRVRVVIEPLGVKRCRVRVHCVHTATSEKGLQFVGGVNFV